MSSHLVIFVYHPRLIVVVSDRDLLIMPKLKYDSGVS